MSGRKPDGWNSYAFSPQWRTRAYPKDLRALCCTCSERLAGDGISKVPPMLKTLFIEGLRQSGSVKVAIGKFIAVRELTGHPVDV